MDELLLDSDLEEKNSSPDVLDRANLHSLRLNQNMYNSCYIDAPFELLVRCTISYIKNSFVNACNQGNSFDMALLDAFKQYENGNSETGNQLIRDFVWAAGTLFIKGDMDDTYFCLDWFIQNTSSKLCSLFSISSLYEINLCTEIEQDVSIIEKSLEVLPFNEGSYPTTKDFYNARKIKKQDEQDLALAVLKKRFEEVYHTHILYKIKEKAFCTMRGRKCAFKSNLIPQENLTEFLFFLVQQTETTTILTATVS